MRILLPLISLGLVRERMLCKERKRILSTSSLINVKGRQRSCLIRAAWDVVGEKWIEAELVFSFVTTTTNPQTQVKPNCFLA